MRPMMKLFNQFEHVASATPFALREDGNISDGIAQGTCTNISLSMAYSNARDQKRSRKKFFWRMREIFCSLSP